jgi:2-(1,2-epoxy-1,2-dihydrophenyl)acetyl-CoA isomerase
MADVLLYDVADGIATITLNRPDEMNSLDTHLKVALRDAVATATGDPTVRAVVLTGAGKAFCVGQDLREHAENLAINPEACWRTVRDHYNPITLTLATMPKPVVAAINGVAAGAGAGFAFASDFRIMSQEAGFNLAFSAVGLSADSGASWTLPRLIGHAKATELMMLPRTISAGEAEALGLVTRLAPAERVLSEATNLAQQLAQGATVAFGAIKRSLAYSAGHSLVESLAFEDEMQSLAGLSEDHRNAVDAFLSKRPPTFVGR